MGWLLSPLALVASLLPDATRKRLGMEYMGLAGATVITGLMQIALALLLFVVGFNRYRANYMESIGEVGGPGAMVLSSALWLGFFLASPVGLFGNYLIIEAAVRITSGALGQPCSSLGPYLVEALFLSYRKSAKEHALPRLVADELRILVPKQSMEICTCRNRRWDDFTTIDVDGEFYRILEHRELEAGSRPHVYVLGPIPSNWVIRRLIRYSPENVLEEFNPRRLREQGL